MDFSNEKHINNVLEFENLICRKNGKGNSRELETLWENRKMLLFIIHDVLGLTEEEYRSLYCVANNNLFHTSKYINRINRIITEQEKTDIYLGRHAKEQIFAILYPDDSNFDSKQEAIRRLNNNEVSFLSYLSKIKDEKKRSTILSYYFHWLIDNIFHLEDKDELYRFMVNAEKISLGKRIPALNLIYLDYSCLMDFYYLNLSKAERVADLLYYKEYRPEIETNLDVLYFLNIL